MRKIMLAVVVMVIMVSPFCWGQARAEEKLRYAISFKEAVSQALPIAVALEKGFWQKQGLDVEYVPFRAGSKMLRAMAAGHIDLGTDNAPGIIQGITRGVPIIMVAATQTGSDWAIWVKPGGPLKRPADLKGKKLGISRRGGTSDAMSRMALKSLGIEAKIIAVGGARARVAALKTGAIDAFPQALSSAAPMAVRGDIERLMDLGSKLPQPWVDQTIIGLNKFVREKPETAKKGIRGLLQALAFVRANPEYAVNKVMSLKRYSRAAAEMSLKGVVYTKSPVINRDAVANVRGFLINYGLIKAVEAPPVDKLYTNELVK